MKKTLTLVLAILLAIGCVGASAEYVPYAKGSLLVALPEDIVSTPDALAVDAEGNLIVTCPNFNNYTDFPSVILKIDKDLNVIKWFDMPLNEETGDGRAMGITFGPDGDLYLIDNAPWLGVPELANSGRILRIRMNGDEIEKVTVVAQHMEHPNGLRIVGDYMYVTESSMSGVSRPDGKLTSGIYRFPLDGENIEVTNSLADEAYLLSTFVTDNLLCQYGLDGITLDNEGRLLVGDFGDAEVYRITLTPDGGIQSCILWSWNPYQILTADGMTVDASGNVYVCDFSANAIGKITPDGVGTRWAFNPDCTGLDETGVLDEPGDPIIWNGKLVVANFDAVVDPFKVNQNRDYPSTLAVFELNQ